MVKSLDFMVALERNPSSIVASFQFSILMRERTCKSWGLAAPRLQLSAAWAAACTWFVCSLRQWSAPIAVDTMVDMVKICWWYLVYAYIS